MNFLPNGVTIVDDIFEMNYNLFNEIGLKVNMQGYLQDEDTGIVLQYKEKYIKATVTPVEIYAGKTDIIFDPATNYHLMATLFGYYLDKMRNSEEGDKIGYIAQYIEDENELREKQRVVVKTRNGEYGSRFYYNVYLGFVECIFGLSGSLVDLTNLDYPPVEVK